MHHVRTHFFKKTLGFQTRIFFANPVPRALSFYSLSFVHGMSISVRLLNMAHYREYFSACIKI